MATYRNGYIPENLLVSIGSGYDEYGRFDWLLSPGTAAKHAALLKRNPALRPSPGYSCYRPYAWQTKYRSIWGNGAAWPGTSSHGGVWEGKQTLAIDYGNWAYCYGSRDGRDTSDKRAAFFADCRAVGFAPNLIRPDRGYPDEPWHVIDLDPWAAVAASGNATPFPEDAMTQADIDAINAHTTALFKNFLGVAGQGYTVPQVIQQDVADIRARIRGPQSEPWDQIQRVRSILEGFANATTPNGVDVTAALRDIEGRLAATFQQGLADLGVELKAQIVAGLSEGDVTPERVEAAIDAALSTLQISRGE